MISYAYELVTCIYPNPDINSSIRTSFLIWSCEAIIHRPIIFGTHCIPAGRRGLINEPMYQARVKRRCLPKVVGAAALATSSVMFSEAFDVSSGVIIGGNQLGHFPPPSSSRHLRRRHRSCCRCTSVSEEEASSQELFDIKVLQGPFSGELLASSKCWGRRPLLIRSAFDAASLLGNKTWPSWDQVSMLGCDEDAESRLITHRPGDSTSWELQLGPFEEEDVQNLIMDPNRHASSETDEGGAQGRKWTLVLNDMDRLHPPLADFIDQRFSFIPQWRRDDGQISLSDEGGGIGPHVDNFDVFLVQASGSRTWQVGRRFINTQEEFDTILEGIDVRVLSGWESDREDGLLETFDLKPGDVLYLPPRVGHCGIATSSESMCLSVGCRAPSAYDMISRIAEVMAEAVSGRAVERITDLDLFDDIHAGKELPPAPAVNCGEISVQAKEKAKRLVLEAVQEYLDEDEIWDDLFGKLVTETNRARIDYPPSLVGPMDGYEDDEDRKVRDDRGVWGDPQLAVSTMLEGRGALYQAEGINFAHTIGEASDEDSVAHHRLFADGNVWEVPATVKSSLLLQAISGQRYLNRDRIAISLGREGSDDAFSLENVPSEIVEILEDLVGKGFLYGSD